MSSSESDFRSSFVSLWLRLITLAIIALMFCEGLRLAQGKAQGWTFYLTPWEVVFEVAVRLVTAALAGVASGTICAAIVAPFLWYFRASRERLADRTTRVAVFVVVFLVSRYALEVVIQWSHFLSTRSDRLKTALFAAHFLAFVLALCIPRVRREVVTSLDGFLGEKMTRRTAMATIVSTAAVVTTEFVLSRAAPAVRAALVPRRPNSNFLLITFDALNAEDMSLYGCRLPTTPNIDTFARKATVFSNFYSASTFTTPSVATILTGLYPSETGVYQLSGRVRAENAAKSLPHLMRSAGYATAAFLSNPLAYYLVQSLRSEFDILPEPTFDKRTQPYWDATRPLHQDSGIGSRFDEYVELEQLWSSLGRLPHNLWIRYRPDKCFDQARQMVATLPDGFFLWVHVVTPHDPYLPDPQDRGRFISEAESRLFENDGHRWQPHYEPDQQSQVDRRRLAYDEFMATADRAFGAFILDLEKSGKLQDTMVIVSADHGESFEGGVYQHQSAYLTRPVIHVPLVIRTPGQQEGRTIAFTADQTSLAPTILEFAGLSKPDWMHGKSLVEWLNRDGQGEGEGLAFTQYLEKNSVFKPLQYGTVGVIDGQYQYVVDLDTQKGALRPLSEAQAWNLDRTSENPTRAEALRAELTSRFPAMVQQST